MATSLEDLLPESRALPLAALRFVRLGLGGRTNLQAFVKHGAHPRYRPNHDDASITGIPGSFICHNENALRP